MNILRTCTLAAAIAATALLHAANAGDPVGWASSVPTDKNIDQARDANWLLTLPAQADILPVGATVKVSSIAIGERPSESEQPTKLRIYTGESTHVDSEAFSPFAQLYGRLGKTTSAVRKLEYRFETDLVLTVGTTYNVKLLNADGVEQASTPGGTGGSYCGAALVMAPGQAMAMDSLKASYSLVYAIKGEVVGNSALPGYTATIAGSATSINFTQDPSGVATWAKISATANSTLNLGGELGGGYSTVSIHVADGVTLSLSSDTVIAADAIEVTGAGVVSLSANTSLRGTIIGNGTIRYASGTPNGITIGEGWCGNVKLADTVTELTNINPNNYGNAISTVTFAGIQGYCLSGTSFFYPCVNLEDNLDANANAYRVSNGSSSAESIFTKISGSGTIRDIHNTTGATHLFRILDASDWSGSIVRNGGYGKRFVFGNGAANSKYGTITIAEDAELTLGASATLGHTSDNGVYVNGTLDISAASFNNKVYGSGTVVCSGKLPGGTYTDEAWTGTVAISDVAPTTPKSGVLYPFNIQNFGNTNSTIRLSSIGSTTEQTAYLPGEITVGRVVLVDNGDTPALRLSDGLSDKCTTFRELAGTGTLKQIKTHIFQGLTINTMTNFTGTIDPAEMTVTFGTSNRAGRVSGDLYKDTEFSRKLFIDPDADISIPAGFTLWEPLGGIVFDGAVNFTTDADDYDSLVLLAGTGGKKNVKFGPNAVIKVNGEEYDRSVYYKRFVGSNLLLFKRHHSYMILR